VYTYALPPQFFSPRVAVIRSANGECLTLANHAEPEDSEPPELHVTHANTLTPGAAFGMSPADQSFVEEGAASRIAWDVTGRSPVPVAGIFNNMRAAAQAVEARARVVLRLYAARRP